MANQETEILDRLRIKLIGQINEKEQEIGALRQQLKAIEQVRELMFKEGLQASLFPVSEGSQPATKYRKYGVSDAVLDAINNGPSQQWSRPEIVKYLKNNGLRSKAKNFYATVNGTIQRLEMTGKIRSVQTDNGKLFTRASGLNQNVEDNNTM